MKILIAVVLSLVIAETWNLYLIHKVEKSIKDGKKWIN